MPLGGKPVCNTCKTSTTTMWRKGTRGEPMCNTCSQKSTDPDTKEAESNDNGNGNGASSKSPPVDAAALNQILMGPQLRKSNRIKPSKTSRSQPRFTPKPVTKGKSRRTAYKKNPPIKAPRAVATIVTADSIFYDSMYYQVGDVVSLVDHDGSVYYAQIRGFMQDQYSEKSVIITWLLPTQNSERNCFDPSTYILGPEEDLPRKMEYIEFVCHAPSDYFQAKNTPYPTLPNKPELCFISSILGSEIMPLSNADDVFSRTDITVKEKLTKHDKKSH